METIANTTNKNHSQDWKIYALQLQNGKFYIGKTKNILSRLEEHVMGKASKWTSIHIPIDIIEILSNPDEFDEDKLVKKYMGTYGIDNVRGGSYAMLELSKMHFELLVREVRSSRDVCLICGIAGHFLKDCQTSAYIGGGGGGSHKERLEISIGGGCVRCGRFTHVVKNCFANTRIDGSLITPISSSCKSYYLTLTPRSEKTSSTFGFDTPCLERIKISKINHVPRSLPLKVQVKSLNCYRCGRSGHFSNSCFAKWHNNKSPFAFQ